LCGWALAMVAAPATGKTFLTAEEALNLAFPAATIAREVAFLTDPEIRQVGELCGERAGSAMVTRFLASRDGAIVGIAYLDTHRVRTLPESLLIVLSPEGTLRRVEVLSFSEPEAYLPRAAWFAQFEDRALDPDLSLKGKIRPIAGATLTSRAVTEATRRVLAVHRTLAERKVE
jgi:hypothetical protein